MHKHYLNKLWRLSPVLTNLGKKLTNLLFKISKEPHHRLYTGQGGSPNLMDRSKYILDRLAQVYSTQQDGIKLVRKTRENEQLIGAIRNGGWMYQKLGTMTL